MWLSKLKKNKGQYFLLGVIFAIAIALISVSTIVTVVSKTFAEEYYKGDSTPDITVITSNERAVEKSHSWYEAEGSEARNYKKLKMFSVSTNLSFNNKVNDSLMSFVIPMDSVDSLSNKINIVEGNTEEKSPKKEEIWIPSTVAKSKKIKVGDIAKIIDSNGKELEFKVSAIVNDSNQSSTAIGVLYIYINEEERESLNSLPTANMVTMNCNGNAKGKSKELVSYINEPIGGGVIDKDSYIATATMTSTITAGLGIMASIILVIILILILRSNIKNNILKEYKSIGIYKAMGYSSKKIRKIYLYGYGLVSIVSSIIGILISIPMVTYICNISFKYLGVYRFDVTSLIIVMVAFLIFNLLVYINLYIVLKSVNKIKPVDAINIGITSSKKKMKKSLIKNSSSSLSTAINDIFKYKKNNLVTLLMFILVFYIATLFLNLANTMMTLDNNLYKIFGTANADLVVAAPGDIDDSIREVKEYLDKDNRVEEYYLWNVIARNKITIDNSKYDVDSGLLMSTTYDKFNEEDFAITEGVNPRNKNEVALNVAIMQSNNFRIGDYITINVEGESREFLIVGSYPSMMGDGQNLRLTNDVLANDSNGNVAFIKLKNVDDYESLKNDINNQFKGITSDKIYTPLIDTASQVVDVAVPTSVILLSGVLIFGILNIMNILITSNIDNRKNYGIMKGLGFTSKYIRQRSNYRIMSLSILGAIIGTLTTVLTSKQLMAATLGFDIFNFNSSMTAVLISITFTLIMLTMHICNRSIKKISTVELIKE